MRENITNYIITALLSAIISMSGYWLIIGRELPTRAEVKEMIQSQAPYVEDRKLIHESIIKNSSIIEKLDETIDEFRVEIAKLNERLK